MKLNARVDIVNENFGGTAVEDATKTDDDKVDTSTKSTTAKWDYAWMTLLTDYGKFDIGRMKGGCFGLSLFDSEATKDRIKWTLPMGDITWLGVVEKNVEIDGATSDYSDADSDAYYGIGIYKKDNITAGLLLASVRGDYVVDSNDPAAGYKLTQTVAIPYWDIKIDDTYGVKGEIYYRPGKEEYDNSATDKDLSGMGYYIAGTGNFGQTKVEVGLAYASGDDPTTDDEDESLVSTGAASGKNAGLGDEWTPFVILQDANALLNTAATAGVMLFYAQADYALSDDMKVTGLIGMATADQVDATQDDSYGTEIDAKLEWKLTDALTYNFNLGYLMAGDYFKGIGGTTEIEDTFTLYHKLQLDF
jgi:hypothetical protein